MGYGASRADLQRVGGVGDGGIDGVISLDKLGLEKVYVQAKRWQNTVDAPKFKASTVLSPASARTRACSSQLPAIRRKPSSSRKSVERVVLVDGARLAELMIDHEVGVSARTVKIPKLDSDYFDEESA